MPFLFDRSRAPLYRLINVGSETLRGVFVTLRGPGLMPATPTAILDPLEWLELTVLGEDLARASALHVRWLRPSGDEFLWRAVF